MSGEQFISEPLVPEAGTADAAAMARGEPGLPHSFKWRGQTLLIREVVKAWKTNAPAGEGSAYLRRHWYTLLLTDGRTITVYCLRHARPGRPHWWLYTIHESAV